MVRRPSETRVVGPERASIRRVDRGGSPGQGRLTRGRRHPPSTPRREQQPRHRAHAAGAPARRGRSTPSCRRLSACSRYSASTFTAHTSCSAPMMFSTESIAVNIEWSWLLYLCMPLRPHGNTLGVFGAEPLAHDGRRAPRSSRRTLDTPSASARRSRPRRGRRRARPRWHSSRMPCSISSVSGLVHMPIALVHEELETEAGTAFLHHERRPRPVVLHPADLARRGRARRPSCRRTSTSGRPTSATVRWSR